MGVPKFYRWISERYPKINQIISDNALLPEFDHLYLDMNGIIHGCTHPPELDVSQVLSERDMVMGIMHYLDRIITQIVKPRVSVYMAIDGVAPRAKLNQQRSRRYRSAKDMADAQEETRKQQQKSSSSSSTTATTSSSSNNSNDVFDSNCITPGTEFLAKISNLIQFFIRKKLKEDPIWNKLTIIFSGHDVPGEGEHKIMNHIRECRNQPNYQPNTRHCIYGQDADLIMLGLVTHEPHFTILRETVDFNSFNKNKDGENSLKQVKKFTKESNFQLLHLSVLREYLAIEFGWLGNHHHQQQQQQHGDVNASPTTQENYHDSIQSNTSSADTTTTTTTNNHYENNETMVVEKIQQYDLERCIDDFVFMTFLVGNDFLPHLPALDIGDGAFDLLFGCYKNLRTSWGPGNYLTDRGDISDPARLESFIAAIGRSETEILGKKKEDDAAFLKKRRKWDKRDGKTSSGPTEEEMAANEAIKFGEYSQMLQALLTKHGNDPDAFVEGWKPPSTQALVGKGGCDGDGDEEAEDPEEDFKGQYYFEKLDLTPIDKDKHWHLRKSYMEGLVWCLAYYYKGCISWGWFFPYHYGPMLSDLINIPRMFKEMKFDMGTPLAPFEQLMACLPPASSTLVPELYRRLMLNPDSPILSFYPTEFVVDMNGKRNPWEGVNLLPFINVDELKKAIKQYCPDNKLSSTERLRNRFGTAVAFRYDSSCIDKVDCPIPSLGLDAIDPSYSSYMAVEEVELELSARFSFEPKLIPGTQIPYPGFPSLNVLPIANVDLVAIGLNCFGMPSKNSTCLLSLAQMPQLAPLQTLAQACLGKSLFVNWPMMHEGKVTAISDETHEIRLVKGKQKITAHSQEAAEMWLAETEAMKQMYYTGDGTPGSGGVNIGPIKMRLRLLPLQGMRTNSTNGSTKKVYGREEADVPLQLALCQAPAPDPRFQERGPLSLEDRYPVGSYVVLLKGKYAGCKGEVVGILDKKLVGVKVQALPVEIPFGLALARTAQESFISSNDAARILKIHPGLLGKITGRLPFEQGRYDLGLNLKSSDGLCVVGYTRKKVVDADNNHTNTVRKKSDAWLAGDALRVVGSKVDDDDDNTSERIIWEYTPKAIRLIEAYRNKFPQMFDTLAKLPNERKYDANIIFGPNGESWLPVIRDWLNNLESAKLPRSPVTTQSMSQEGVAAVQKAADVRRLALQKRGYPKQLFIKVPGSALFREASAGATDIISAFDSSKQDSNDGPRLGDRIVNLAADGIPFGLRGTVVGIHEAATTGCVEVVMDEEFMGGSSLQGSCSKFRGKLCPWSRLLKIAPKDNDSLVDKLVPKGSGKAAVDKIIASIDPSVQIPKEGDRKPLSQPTVPKQPPKQQHQQLQPINQKSRSTSAPASSPRVSATKTAPSVKAMQRSRTPSIGDRQAGWREAQGPLQKNIGFKWKKGDTRDGRNGLAEWRNRLEMNKLKKEEQHATLHLKAMLGVNAGTAPSAMMPEAITPATSKTPADAESTLKSLLGVGTENSQRNEIPQASASQSVPETAANKLLALMAKNTPSHQSPQLQPYHPGIMAPLPTSNFNFTYVEEGSSGMATIYPPQPPPPSFMMMQPPPQPSQPSYHIPGHFPPLQPQIPVASQTSMFVTNDTPLKKEQPKTAPSSATEMTMVPSVVVRR